MKYNFDEFVDRKNTGSVKWDCLKDFFGDENILPMWVADMDFNSPAPVIEAIKTRAQHGIYGYTEKPDSCYEAVIEWVRKRHGWNIDREWIIFCPGVVPSLSTAVMAYTSPGDSILIQPPVYHPFFNAVDNNERHLISNRLVQNKNSYSMNFEDLEGKLVPEVKMAILCNPHNPVGRVWRQDELLRYGELCAKNNTVIVSDEIHSDIIFKGFKHIPIASISEELSMNTITCMAPSKTFNIAGLATSIVIIPNPKLRKLFIDTIEKIGITTSNTFGITAAEASYRYGGEWLEQLMEYLEENVDFLIKYASERIPGVKAVKPEGTYLVWLDFRELNMKMDELRVFLVSKARIGLNNGTDFGSEGNGFMRINIGCPRSILKEGLSRLEGAVRSLRI